MSTAKVLRSGLPPIPPLRARGTAPPPVPRIPVRPSAPPGLVPRPPVVPASPELHPFAAPIVAAPLVAAPPRPGAETELFTKWLDEGPEETQPPITNGLETLEFVREDPADVRLRPRPWPLVLAFVALCIAGMMAAVIVLAARH